MHTGPGSPANPDRKPLPFSSPGAWGQSFILFLLKKKKKDFSLLCVPPHHCNLVQNHLRGPKLQPGTCAHPVTPKYSPQQSGGRRPRHAEAPTEETQTDRTPHGAPQRAFTRTL